MIGWGKIFSGFGLVNCFNLTQSNDIQLYPTLPVNQHWHSRKAARRGHSSFLGGYVALCTSCKRGENPSPPYPSPPLPFCSFWCSDCFLSDSDLACAKMKAQMRRGSMEEIHCQSCGRWYAPSWYAAGSYNLRENPARWRQCAPNADSLADELFYCEEGGWSAWDRHCSRGGNDVGMIYPLAHELDENGLVAAKPRHALHKLILQNEPVHSSSISKFGARAWQRGFSGNIFVTCF